MRLSNRAWLATPALAFAALMAVGTARADNLTLNCTLHQNGTVPASCNTTPTLLDVPGAYGYVNADLDPVGATGGLITHNTDGSPISTPKNSFYDVYIFEISQSAVGSSVSSTIDLFFPGQPSPAFQITNFQQRLYKLDDTGGVAPYVGPITDAIAFWTTAQTIGSSTITVSGLAPTQLTEAGIYVLEVRGNVTGAFGGAYSGTLQLAPPVPLPAAAWLLISGLAGLTVVGRRRAHT